MGLITARTFSFFHSYWFLLSLVASCSPSLVAGWLSSFLPANGSSVDKWLKLVAKRSTKETGVTETRSNDIDDDNQEDSNATKE